MGKEKRNFTIISLLMVMVLCLTMLSGCSNQSNTSDPGNKGSQSSKVMGESDSSNKKAGNSSNKTADTVTSDTAQKSDTQGSTSKPKSNVSSSSSKATTSYTTSEKSKPQSTSSNKTSSAAPHTSSTQPQKITLSLISGVSGRNPVSDTLKEKGDAIKYSVEISPAGARADIIWKSSRSDVATVKNGLVTAVSNGTTTITASTADGLASVSCNVVVQIGKYTQSEIVTFDTNMDVCGDSISMVEDSLYDAYSDSYSGDAMSVLSDLIMASTFSSMLIDFCTDTISQNEGIYAAAQNLVRACERAEDIVSGMTTFGTNSTLAYNLRSAIEDAQEACGDLEDLIGTIRYRYCN